VALWVSLGFILSIILRNILKDKQETEEIRAEKLESNFINVVKTQEFSELFQTQEFRDILTTNAFRKFAKLYGTQQLLDILTK